MPIKIIRQDITKLKVDAIVNTTNSNLDASGGLEATRRIRRLDRMDAKTVPIFAMTQMCLWLILNVQKRQG